MASFTGNSIKDVYKDILHTSNSNSGIGSSIKQITCGDGDTTALYLSDRNAKIQPSADTTTNTVIYDADGNALVTVDSTNDLVKAGVGQHTVNTQYAHFGISTASSTWSSGATADYHMVIPFNNYLGAQGVVALGNGTNPDTSHTISSTADDVTVFLWYIMDNMTIDRVVWWSGGDSATGDVTRAHLMGYDIVTTAGASSGDLSNGAVLADGADITNAGNEQAYYQQMTIQSANVDAGKAVLFAFRSDSTANSDYTINATVKYHLR